MTEEKEEELQFKKVDTKDTETSAKISKLIEEVKIRKMLSVEKSIESIRNENLLDMDKNAFIDIMLNTNTEYIKIILLRDIALSLRKGLQIDKEQQ